MDREGLISVALGDEPADMLVSSGRLLNVYTGEIYPADVLIKGGRIAYVGDVGSKSAELAKLKLDAAGKYLTPGLIDAHIHVVESLVTPSQFAKAVIPHGTTSVIGDFCNFFSVAGIEGIRFCLADAKRSPLKTYMMLMTQHMGLEHLGTFNRTKEEMRNEIKQMLQWDETIGIAEPPLNLVLERDPSMTDLIKTTCRMKKIYAGHFSYPIDERLQAYITSGASSDHESRTALEGMAKVRLGMRVFLREASPSPDLSEVLKAVTQKRLESRYFAMCSDDEDASDLVEYGHMDYKVRLAVSNGLDPITAVQMATLNAAEAYDLDGEIGAIAPGKLADLLIVDDLAKFKVNIVVANGKVVAQNGIASYAIETTSVPEHLKNTIWLRRKLTRNDFRISGPKYRDSATVRVIGVEEGTILKKWLTAHLRIEDGSILPNIDKDILKMCVVESRKGTGNISAGFIHGFGLREGAVATTSNHQWYQLLTVGTDEGDMALACNELQRVGGGFIAVRNGEVLRQLSLPIGGLVADMPVEELAREFNSMRETLEKLGCKLRSPFQVLAFSTLPSVPECSLTDLGLVDSSAMKLVDLMVK